MADSNPDFPTPEEYEYMVDFDNDGEWDHNGQVGPAIHAPLFVKNIPINGYRIEWLNMSEPLAGFYAKNHMVATLMFDETNIGGKRYRSARLSIELGMTKVVQDVGRKDWYPGIHYLPGTYTLKLLKYGDPTIRSVHNRTFLVRQGLRVGSFTDKIIDQNMHHFLFLPYTSEGFWKGCGDHTIHSWAVFVREGYLLSQQSIEEPDRPVNIEFTYTYLANGSSTWEQLGRGWWLNHNPVEDELVPESTFTERRPTYLLPSKQVQSSEDHEEDDDQSLTVTG